MNFFLGLTMPKWAEIWSKRCTGLVPLTDLWSSMISWMVVRPQMRTRKISKEHRPHHRSSPLQQMELYQCGNSWRFVWNCLPLWCKADCETQRLQVEHFIQIFCHGALEKYSKIHRVGEYNPWTFYLESPKRLSRGCTVLPQGPPYLEKGKCVSTSHMRRDASWMHRDTRHNNW